MMSATQMSAKPAASAGPKLSWKRATPHSSCRLGAMYCRTPTVE